MYKLCFYVPDTHVEAVKEAMFEAGAGRIGDYRRCAWQVEGQGQFEPLPGSQPFIGETHTLEILREFRVEMVCDDACLHDVVAALRAAHPYEEPAFDVLRVVDVS